MNDFDKKDDDTHKPQEGYVFRAPKSDRYRVNLPGGSVEVYVEEGENPIAKAWEKVSEELKACPFCGYDSVGVGPDHNALAYYRVLL